MNDAFYTQTGERPDLAAVEVNTPEGYIASKILPIVPTVDKSGTIYYATITADAAAQTGRSAGTAPTATQISDSSTTFSTAENVKRGAITPDEAKQMGGIAKADMVGSKWAKRQVMNALESDVCTLVLGGSADYTFDPANLLKQAQVAKQAVRLYSGKTTLISSTQVVTNIVQSVLADSTYGTPMSRLISGTSPTVAVEGMNFKNWVAGLAMFLGIDEVLLGDDTIWNATAVTGRFAIAKIDNSGDEMSHKWNPVFGKTYQFMPNGTNPWVIQSVADRVAVNNLYDAYLWMDTKVLNSGAMKLFSGVQA